MAMADGIAGHDEADYIPSERQPMDITNDEALARQSQSHHAELEDDNAHLDAPRPASARYAEDYSPADVAHILRTSRTAFDILKEEGPAENPWAPFNDEDEWELARFLIKEASQTATDKFLKLSIVSGWLFHTRDRMTAKLTYLSTNRNASDKNLHSTQLHEQLHAFKEDRHPPNQIGVEMRCHQSHGQCNWGRWEARV